MSLALCDFQRKEYFVRQHRYVAHCSPLKLEPSGCGPRYHLNVKAVALEQSGYLQNFDTGEISLDGDGKRVAFPRVLLNGEFSYVARDRELPDLQRDKSEANGRYR